MTETRELVAHFLTALAQAMSAMTLYKRSHPAVERAIGSAYDHLFQLQCAEPRPSLTFLGDEVVFKDRPLKGLRSWEWGPRLAEVGVQRLEFDGPASRTDFDGFVDALYHRLADVEAPTEGGEGGSNAIRFGAVGLREGDGLLADVGTLIGYTLSDEIETMQWVDQECRTRGTLHLVEADTIVRSLALAMHADAEVMIPLVHLKGYDQYTTTHSLNISVLSMALAEFIGLPSKDVRRIGIAGLLHDIGKTRVPQELLNKSGKLTDEEFAAIQRHPVEGAKILIEREANLDLAATVAYEHHIKYDGGGYPKRTYPRKCHPASDLVHLCDVYDALRTHRPYRKAWTQERVLGYIEEELGAEFEPELGRAFLGMMRRWGSRLYRITSKDDAVPVGESDEPDEEPAQTTDVESPTPGSGQVGLASDVESDLTEEALERPRGPRAPAVPS